MPIGICFEPLEPRLLLSGTWGAGVDASPAGSQANAHGGFTQETVVISENTLGSATDTQRQNPRQTAVYVDLLAQAPVLNAVNAADPVLEAPTNSDQAAPAAGDIPINGTESDSDMQPYRNSAAGNFELVIVNENIADYQQLIADLQGENTGRIIEVVVLDADRDGIEQVSEILAVRSDLAAVHFISHGADGQILLGNSSLDSTTLQKNIAAISSWGNALTETGDILFYGCNIAAGNAGQHLLNDIARITGADVAASSDLTGNAKPGGDWVLEYTKGEIETDIAFTGIVQQSWKGVLGQITVTTTNDTLDNDADTSSLAALEANPGADGEVSLREAIIAANTDEGVADEIILNTGIYTLSLTGANEDVAASGDLDVTDDLIISGAGARTTVIDGAFSDRVFEVIGSTVTISGITIQNGSANDGGGIRLDGSSSLTLRDSAVSGNHAIDTGGAILVSGLLTIDRATIEGNSADVGGGIYVSNGAGASLLNSTLSGNTAINGGAVLTRSTIDITNSTIANNNATAGSGGIHTMATGNASLKNTILAYNTGGNSNGALISLGNNIDSDGSALLGDPLDGVDPMLGPLADNGGQTKTHALLVGSPAVNAGTAAGAPVVDQRGISRDAIPDIGAFESQNNVIVVDTTSDAADGDTSSITGLLGDKGADGRISLREAIIASNNTANIDGSDWILFNISGAGPHTILLTSALPAITDAVIIDGWSEPDFVGVPVIELNGTSAGGSTDGLRITSGGVTIRGLVINRFGGNGIIITGAGGNTIQGNYVGTNTAGTADLGNSLDGIRIDNSANNIIGGTTTQTRNIISGNNIHGVRIIGSASTSNTVQGNYIGVNSSGSGALGNSYNGIWVAAGASNNLLGGTALGAGNVISGNSDTGLEIQDSNSTGNRVEGNIIGLNAAGTAAIGNLDGVIIEDAPHNTIGGTTSAQRNVISGNTGGLQGNGVVIFGADAIGNLVQNNYIGTDVTGSLDLGNTGSGVLISDNGDGGVFKGGASGNTIRDNVLSGNNYSGVSIANSGANNNFIFGNVIGADVSGLGALGNSFFGVVIWNGASGNQIGGTAAGEGNVIAFNNRGVLVDANFTASMNNAIRGNSIHSNALLGIDLRNDGVTLNDPGDGDFGPNGLRNYPVITSAVVTDTDLTITGTLNTLPFLTNQIDFYWSPTGDPSGHGEGRTFIGTVTVTSDFSGNASFNVTFFGVSVPVGAAITATATDLSGNTSEFSLNVTAIKGNEAPVINDQSYSANENAANGTVVGIVLATDPDVGDSLTYFITAGNTGSAFAIDASTGQITVNNSAALDYETIPSFSLTVEVSDNGTPGLTDSATVTINLNDINDVPVGAPTITGLVLEDQTLTADTSGITDDDGIGAFSYQWLRDGINIAGATGSTYTLGDADVGTRISVQVSYTDGHGTTEGPLVSAQTAPVANVNDAPTGSVSIGGTPAEDQTLTATNTLADADGMGVVSYQWRRDGVDIAGATGSSYTLGDLDVGTTVTVVARYTDGHGASESVPSAGVGPVANVNDAPTGSVSISGTPAEDQTLTATNTLADADGMGVVSYQWRRDGVDIAGATGSSYTLGDLDVGTTVTVVARYTDGHGASETVPSAGVGPVANVNDAPTGSVSIGGTPAEDQTLTATNTLADADGMGVVTYQWRRDGVDIAGATGSSYTLGDLDVGTTVTVVARYTDGHGASESVPSAGVGPVANVNDAPTGSVSIGGTPAEDQTLTATNTLADADGMGVVSYQWRRDGVDIAGATGSSYTLGDLDVGTTVTVVARYTDGHGASETVPSAGVGPVANVNDAPTGSVSIGGTPAEDQTLTATNTLADADGMGVVSYQWRRDGVDIAGATGSSYTLGDLDVGTTVTVVARYTDGHGTIETVPSAGVGPVANVNDAPTGSVSIGGTPAEDQTLTATNTLADADGMGVVSYQWRRDGVDIAGATGSSYTLGDLDVGTTVTVVARYTDGHGTSESVPSAGVGPVSHLNVAPTASNLNAAETFTEDIPLNLADIVVADVDGANVTVTLTLTDPVAGSLSTGTSGAVTATYSAGVWTASGPIADVNALLAGVVFTPSANYDGSFAIGVSVNDGVAAPVTGIKIVTGTPVGDTPQVGSITTPVSVQSDLIVIDRNVADGAEVTHFRIANITNGTLYLADGVTPIYDGDFITVAQGLAGVRFTPVADTLDNGSFSVESSEDGVSVAQQSGAAISEITVIPPSTSPTVTIPSDSGDTAGPGPDTAPEAAEPAAETEAAPEEDVPEAVAPPANRGPAEESVPQHRGLANAPMPFLAQAVRYVSQMRAAGVDLKDIAERLSDNVGPSQKAAAADPGPQRADLQAGVHNLISARAYLNMVNSLDAVKKEMAGDNQLNRVYLGSAIVSSIGLSVGYVVWLIRGGLLLSSLLSSLPAWQILDPLPILARKKDDEHSEDDESLESILDRKPPEPKPKKEPADASSDAEEKKR